MPIDKQLELPLPELAPSNTIIINERCTLRKEENLRVVSVAGLPMHHWVNGDKMAEAYAMLSLVQCGYANQKEVARAFGYTTRTLRYHQKRYEAGGMCELNRSACRPKGTQAEPGPWVGRASMLQSNGISIREIAHRLSVSKSTVSRWLTRLGQSMASSTNQSVQPQSNNAMNSSGDTVIASSVKTQNTEEPQGWSLDRDPTNRIFDRLLARLGLLDDASPMFISGKGIPHAGVLLAIPALVESGIFAVAEEVYGKMGPAFYGLRSTILTLLLMSLLRIKRLEGLKEHAPPDMGRVLGLDRAPEVKTLRRKLSQMAQLGKSEHFGRKLAQRGVAKRGAMMGFLYVDGHVRVYHGQKRIPKTYATRMRMALPATTDYWVNDKTGDPIFVMTAEVNEGVVKILPKLLEEVRDLVGQRRVTIVFDRGGWSPKLFMKLIKSDFDILTYRKGKWTKIPRSQFTTHTKWIEGRKISYELNDRNIRLLKGRLRLRQITRLSLTFHQTPIVSSRCDLLAVEVAYRMFERWRQENFFKYLREEFKIDALVDYTAYPEDPERSVPNPKRLKLGKKLATARTKLKRIQTLYGHAILNNQESRRPTVRGFKIAYGKLGRQIRQAQKQMHLIGDRMSLEPKRILVKNLTGEPLLPCPRNANTSQTV